MTNNSEGDRLDRIEALVEKIGQRVDSNARAIEALTESNGEAKKERARLYQIMSELAQTQANLTQAQANLAQAQANLAQAQADNQNLMYRFIENIEEQQKQLNKRQGDIVEILKLLTSNN